jgi:tRNA nucleotidyltransferase (CCA-adding enzyme)
VEKMQIYLVGGAVRDALLNLDITDRDWVVVGATPKEMLEQGFKRVGHDFPVFLHPDTGEEYALARSEKKTGEGYQGFSFDTHPQITLEEDLSRRDLTINAMAQTAEGQLIDPFNGQKDLQNGLLRHVTLAFSEDPLRVLRIARFKARFAQWGFRIAHGTHNLMKKMVSEGELAHLTPERVWLECQKSLTTQQPAQFFRVLLGCHALAVVFPEISEWFETAEAHQSPTEDKRGEYALQAMDAAAKAGYDSNVVLAALCRYTTVLEPKNGLTHLKMLSKRLKWPKKTAELCLLSATYGNVFFDWKTLGTTEKLHFLEKTDAFRRQSRFIELLQACVVSGEPVKAQTCLLGWQRDADCCRQVPIENLQKKHQGPALGKAIKAFRMNALMEIDSDNTD